MGCEEIIVSINAIFINLEKRNNFIYRFKEC
jgi:hypothetical protein